MTQKVEISDKDGTYKCIPGDMFLKCGEYILNSSSLDGQINFPSYWSDDHNQSFGLSKIENIIKNGNLYTPLPANNGMIF